MHRSGTARNVCDTRSIQNPSDFEINFVNHLFTVQTKTQKAVELYQRLKKMFIVNNNQECSISVCTILSTTDNYPIHGGGINIPDVSHPCCTHCYLLHKIIKKTKSHDKQLWHWWIIIPQSAVGQELPELLLGQSALWRVEISLWLADSALWEMMIAPLWLSAPQHQPACGNAGLQFPTENIDSNFL